MCASSWSRSCGPRERCKSRKASSLTARSRALTAHGATGTIETHFEGRYTRFEKLSQPRDEPASY